MENRKNSFILYLDNYPMLAELSMEQRGWLLTALYVYADRLSRDQDTTLEQVLEGFPDLESQTRVACGFMAANICRDSQRWYAQRQARSQRRSGQREAAAGKGTDSTDQRAREDMERVQRMMEQFKRGEGEGVCS